MFTHFLLLSIAVCGVNGLIFSPYKDVGVNLNWNTNIISTPFFTSPSGTLQSILNVLPSAGVDTVTWAFAAGTCGSETWSSIDGSKIADANVNLWVAAGKKYIISTGGAAGSFKCASDADFETFINRYYSASMIGVDFDIEGGMSQEDINDLVHRVQNTKAKYPNLRFSFTLATLSGDSNPTLGDLGQKTMSAIKSIGLKDYYINLMVMDYGSAASPNICVVVGNSCDMGQSAVRAAENLHAQYGVPYDHIELTPMIGGNDVIGETFTIEDVNTVTKFSLENNLGGLHYWSFDRDTDCPPGPASPTCNSYGKAGTLVFAEKFTTNLSQGPSPTPTPQPAPTPSPTPVPAPTPLPPTPLPPTPVEKLCTEANCHNGCLWVVNETLNCFSTYPKASCEAYFGQGYYWCV